MEAAGEGVPEEGPERRPEAGATASARLRTQQVTEQILLSALRDQDAADAASVGRRQAQFLADASLRLGEALDEDVTHEVIAGLSLPGIDAWSVVDVVEAGGGLRRLALMHPDERKNAVARALVGRWLPRATDSIGVPAVMRHRKPVIIADDLEAALSVAAHDAATLRALRWLGVGPLLVVPILSHGELLGAITFVSHPGAAVYSPDDVLLGEALAERCAQALVSARLYGAAQALRAEADSARADAENALAEAEAARAEAELANESKAHFLRTMSHELRTPLNAIGGYAELIGLEIYGPVTPEQQRALHRIQRSQHHLLGLINGVLDYARLDAGVVQYDMTEVLLADVLAGCYNIMEPQAAERRLTLRVVPSDRPLAVRADAVKLQQVVLNLISNAMRFTEPGGSITLLSNGEGEGADERVAIRVIDTGRGIPADKHELIFEAFAQVDVALTRTKQGTGLGLSISRELARGMGGDVTVTSEVGRGSTFTVTLPAASSPA